MSVLPPATIAIIGAGPIGLEAALYARFLGYDVRVYDRGRLAENMLRWGHVRMFSPFGMNASPLGRAAIQAQDATWQAPADDAIISGREFAEAYLLPLSWTDLLRDHLREQSEVICVGRSASLKTELIGQAARGDDHFRLLVRDAAGQQRVDEADIVIDASGTFGNHGHLGQGGIAAIGEEDARERITYELPDILGEDRERYAGRRVLVVGSGYSAATSIVTLTALSDEVPETSAVWVTRPRIADDDSDVPAKAEPIPLIPNDRLSERDALARAANALAAAATSVIEYRPRRWIRAIALDAAAEHLVVDLVSSARDLGDDVDDAVKDNAVESVTVDQIIANVGYRPDHSLSSELQFHRCYASDGPMQLAAAMLAQTSTTTAADCLDQVAVGPEALLTPEPDFYVLGAKSFGRSSRFLIAVGLTQIRDLFTIIGDRAELDLYNTTASLGDAT